LVSDLSMICLMATIEIPFQSSFIYRNQSFGFLSIGARTHPLTVIKPQTNIYG
jgi:hypothetical protein